MAAQRERILSPTFALISAATFFFFVSTSAMFPVLPRHIRDLGASSFLVGALLGSFLISAVALRPLAGRYIDRKGRKLFILLGFGANTISCLGYAFAPDLLGIFWVRLINGAAMACFYPASAALVADLSPESRRAEFFSYYSLFLFAGLGIGPAIGEHLYLESGARVVFITAAVVSVVGVAFAFSIKDSYVAQPADVHLPLLNRAALFPALILGLAALSAGGAEAFLPLYVTDEGSGDTRPFFIGFAVTIMIVRVVAGRLADKYGRAAVIFPGLILTALAMIVLSLSASALTILAAGVLRGVGWGILFPGLFGLTIDRVPASERGSATGTLTSGFDIAAGTGQLLMGAILQATSFRMVFLTGALAALIGAGTFAAGRSRLSAPVMAGSSPTSGVQ